jgi:hypothetical protein
MPSGAIVTFDPLELVIIELDTGDDNELSVVEIYSEWKVWQKTDANARWPLAFRYVGADPISPTQNLGSTFFLTNGWRFRAAERDHKLTLVGNIFTEGGEDSVFVPTLGAYTVNTETRVSNLVDSAVARLDLAQLQEYVFIDTINGTPGTDLGIGVPTNPVNNIADAFTIAVRDKLLGFSVRGVVLLDRAVTGWAFKATVTGQGTVDFNSQVTSGCTFNGLIITGDAAGGSINAAYCHILTLTNVHGSFNQCALNSLFTPGDDTTTTLAYCYSNVPGSGTPVINLGVLQSDNLQVRAYSGGLELQNIDVPTQKVSVDMISGHLKLHSSCTAGEVVARGLGKITDDSGPGLTLDKAGFIDGNTYPTLIANSVWDVPTIDHRDAASIGELVWKIYLSKFDAPT